MEIPQPPRTSSFHVQPLTCKTIFPYPKPEFPVSHPGRTAPPPVSGNREESDSYFSAALVDIRNTFGLPSLRLKEITNTSACTGMHPYPECSVFCVDAHDKCYIKYILNAIK